MPFQIKKKAIKRQFLYFIVFQYLAGRRLLGLLPAGWQETSALVTAGWQETKNSPASRLAGDLAFCVFSKLSTCLQYIGDSHHQESKEVINVTPRDGLNSPTVRRLAERSALGAAYGLSWAHCL